MLENGMSVLDGILPKDPQFGVLDGDMVSELLEKSENNVVVNGAVHHADTAKMNGDISGGKRLLGEYVDNSPAKKQALEAGAGVVVTNGGHGNGSLNGSGMMPVAAAGGQLVRNSAGQIFLKTASASGGLVLQPAGGAGGQVMVQGGGQDSNGGQQKLVFLQQSQRPQHQQTVVRVTAPVAQVGVAAPAPPPGQAGDLPQVDGAVDSEGEEESSPVPQVDGSDGTTVEPATSTQPPADQQQQQQPQSPQQPQQGSSPSVPQPSVIQARPGSQPTEPSPSPPPAAASPGPSQGVKIDTSKPFLCEWQGCMMAYKTPKEVENHAISVHCPLGSDDIPCLWARCDGMKRKRFSLMTHLQDRHCHPQASDLSCTQFILIPNTMRGCVNTLVSAVQQFIVSRRHCLTTEQKFYLAKYFYFILLSLAADEADGGAPCPDPADRQVGRAAAARPARAPRLRAQRRPPRHQATRRGVRKPQGKCGELIDISIP